MALSPSAINKVADPDSGCLRRYAFTYLHGQWEEGELAQTTAGKLVHEILEYSNDEPVYEEKIWGGKVFLKKDYKDLGKWIDFPFHLSHMAHLIQEEVRDLGESVLREYKFDVTLFGIAFKGVIDRLGPRYVTDYKTTGSDLKWAKTPEKLETDVQRLVYTEVFPDRTDALWITGGWNIRDWPLQQPAVYVAHLPLDRKKDKERFKLHVLKPAEQILALSKDVDPLSLPLPGPIGKKGICKPCEKFPPKGCPFVEKCFPKKRTMSSILEKLEKKELSSTNIPPEVEKLALTIPPPAAPVSAESPWKEIAKEPIQWDKMSSEHQQAGFLIENLYIDCFPLNQLDTPLEYSYSHIAAASQEVAADMGVLSPMLIEFGKGPHMVTAQLMQMLRDRETPIKYFFLETRSAEGRNAMQELTANARFVVKGCY